MRLELSADSAMILVAFLCYLAGVAALGIVSHRFLKGGSFVKEYFVGNRGLGPWVLALSVAATAISGGTFMGFPSLIYTNGWVMTLWIGGYMAVPLTTLVLLGKRINQVARIAGSVTVPDVLRDRFQSPSLGVFATLIILLFLAVNLVAQFKAGGTVIQSALDLPAEKPSPALKTASLVGALSAPLGQGPLAASSTLAVKTPRPAGLQTGYVIGLIFFALTVVAYTTYGGFWAVTWTDVLEGLVMLVGVLVMAFLAIREVPAAGPNLELTGLAAATEHLRQADERLVYGPGPKDFLPLGMAFSFFLMWPLTSAGQPSSMVRLMSFKDSASVRRALLLIVVYYLLTYLSLLIVFVCARAIYPVEYLQSSGSEALGEPDEIMPVMARRVAHPLVAGMLLAAPYAAIMSTVAAFLLIISSSLVRDLYQRCWNPEASPGRLKAISYAVTALVGIGVMIAALNPPRFLQYIIVFSGTGLGCSFLAPMGLALYWKRATKAGVFAAMIGGFGAVFGLYVLGWVDTFCQKAKLQGDANALLTWIDATLRWLPGWGQQRPDPFNPLFLGGVDTVIWGLSVSLILGVIVSLLTRPDKALVGKYFPERVK